MLSTAIGCLYDNTVFTEFIKDIKKSKAAALFLSFKDSEYTVDKTVLSEAESICLPVFSVPWHFKFSDISDFVIKNIYEKNIELYKTVQDKLFNAYFTSKDINYASEIIASFLCSPVAVYDRWGEVKAKTFDDENNSSEFLKIDISINEFLMGYIYIYNSGGGKQSSKFKIYNTQLIKKYICLPVSLWFNRESIENMVVFKLKNDFVWDLANGGYESFAEMAKQGIKFGFNLYKPYTCIAVKIMSSKESGFVNEYTHKAAVMMSKAEDIIKECGKKSGLNIMLANRGLIFIIYIENTNAEPQKAVDLFLERAKKDITNGIDNIKMYCGISEVSLEKADFTTLYNQAVLSLHYCENSKNTSYRFTYRDTKILRIILVLQKNGDIRQMAFDTVNKLLDYDKNSDIDLMGTLTEFINCNYNTSLTARKLHIHRQSLLYRLDKIEKVVKMSLQSRKDLFLLEIFTRIYRDY